MLDISQFRRHVLQPTLRHLDLYSPAAEELLIGTAIQESGLCHLHQWQGGAGRGIYQVAPATHDDLLFNYLAHENDLRTRIGRLVAPTPNRIEQLIINLAYATAIARVIYYRQPEPLPAADDVEGQAQYWKRHFNTEKGTGTASDFHINYMEHVKD